MASPTAHAGFAYSALTNELTVYGRPVPRWLADEASERIRRGESRTRVESWLIAQMEHQMFGAGALGPRVSPTPNATSTADVAKCSPPVPNPASNGTHRKEILCLL